MLPEDRSTTAVVAVLGVLVAFGPMGMDMYLPALPAIAQDFGVPIHSIEVTLSAFVIGFALGPLIAGPLSDRYGRLRVLALGVLLFTLATVFCALAPDNVALILGRFLQGLGGGVAPVIARASVRDLYRGNRAASVLSMVHAVMLMAPMVAPIIGGYLLLWSGWRANFWTLTAFGIAALGLYGTVVGEPHAVDRRVHVFATFKAYAQLLVHRRALGYLLTSSLGFAGLYAFLTESPYVYIEYFGVPAHDYGVLFAINVIGSLLGAILNSRLVISMGISRLLTLGALLALVAGVGLYGLAMLDLINLPWIVAGISMYLLALGFLAGNAMAAVMNAYPHYAGAVSALFSFSQFGIGALTSAAVSMLHDGTLAPMLGALAVSGILSSAARMLLIVEVKGVRP